MAKSSADDAELRRACEAAIEGTKQKVVMSIRVAKSRGIWGKSGMLGRQQMAKPRVLALSSTFLMFNSIVFTYTLNFIFQLIIISLLSIRSLNSKFLIEYMEFISLYCFFLYLPLLFDYLFQSLVSLNLEPISFIC